MTSSAIMTSSSASLGSPAGASASQYLHPDYIQMMPSSVSTTRVQYSIVDLIYSSLFARSGSIARSENEIATTKKKRKKTHNDSDTSHELHRALNCNDMVYTTNREDFL